jgi:hypothetical protein
MSTTPRNTRRISRKASKPPRGESGRIQILPSLSEILPQPVPHASGRHTEVHSGRPPSGCGHGAPSPGRAGLFRSGLAAFFLISRTAKGICESCKVAGMPAVVPARQFGSILLRDVVIAVVAVHSIRGLLHGSEYQTKSQQIRPGHWPPCVSFPSCEHLWSLRLTPWAIVCRCSAPVERGLGGMDPGRRTPAKPVRFEYPPSDHSSARSAARRETMPGLPLVFVCDLFRCLRRFTTAGPA